MSGIVSGIGKAFTSVIGSAVKVGQAVLPSEVVGLSGSTGLSTGPHLHLEIHPDGKAAVDPSPWFAARGMAF